MHPTRILVVEDRPELRFLALIALDPLRYAVAFAQGVPAARAMFRRGHRFEVALLDASVPDATTARFVAIARRHVARVACLGVRGPIAGASSSPRPSTFDELRSLIATLSDPRLEASS